ncbi:FecR domain-containing protein [Leptothoe spongobia]|uniref:FecR domain-containing protein n=1 Tax=Leptothoe spongobia TAU-MAC 1115 TaxID=1967444 RepID=A0A947DIC6_9CYAN|nr:FecR domain-containing protein [Leptothoe spongobia]MBT9317558.1 FecR domain-containing protein [Leptothoe spongobia TAU-MAC 1115]
MEKLNVAATGRWLSLVCASLGMLLSMPRSANAQSALTWARVELTRNQVQLFTNGQSRRAKISDVLGVNDSLSTARSARAELRFNDGSLARIGESAVFRFTPNTRNFRLSNGTVLLLIPPGQGRTTIQTPNATTGIHGSALFVRFVPETNTTIIGALTNNSEGPMMAFNEDGSVQQPLYAGEMAVLQGDGILQHFSFDMVEFYETSDLLADMQLDDPEATTGDVGLDAVRQEIQDALNQQQQFENDDDVIENPAFLSANPNAPIASVTYIQDFARSPAANFLQQDGIEFSRLANPPSAQVEPPPTPQPPPPQPPTPQPDPPTPNPPVEPQPPTPPVKPEVGEIAPQPTQPVTPDPINAGGPTTPGNGPNQPGGQPVIPETTAPNPVQPIDKPTPINEPVVIEQPAPAPVPTPEIVIAPEAPTAAPNELINQLIEKPTELPNTPVVPVEPTVLPPETIIPPIETVVEPETEAQIDRLPDDVIVQEALPPTTDPGETNPADTPPPGQVGATPGQSGEPPPGQVGATPGQGGNI